MNYYNVQFVADYFVITTQVHADNVEQCKRLAETWLDENGLNISQYEIKQVIVTIEGEVQE
jgi:hypothetical protein